MAGSPNYHQEDGEGNSRSQNQRFEFANNGLSTQRSGEPYEKQMAMVSPSEQNQQHTPTATNQDGVVNTSENALVPMNDGRTMNGEAVDNIPDDMLLLMEEMESVLYSISFGK
mmetsp:Transcript_8486/g.11696  ORF Transcript_8486/g.11696 Transcript_8486/m.11696 type:complete len:113 (-) Transcript_8486:2276-2614(-)